MVKNVDFWAYVLIDENGEEIFRIFSKKELQSILIKKKVIIYMLNWKAMIIIYY